MKMKHKGTMVKRFTGGLSCALVLAALSGSPARGADYIFVVDFDAGSIPSDDSKGTWQACGDATGGCDCGVGTSVRYVDQPVRRPGGKAVRIRLKHCHERAEISMNRKLVEPTNTPLWCGFSVYIPNDFKDMDDSGPRRWDFICQWHHVIASCAGRGHNEIEIRNHRLRLALKTPGKKWDLGHIDKFKGRWNDFVTNHSWSNGSGFFKLWVNAGPDGGAPVVDFKGKTYPCTATGPYFKAGLYKGNPDWTEPEPRIVFIDELRLAKNAGYADVYPGLTNESTGTAGPRAGAAGPAMPRVLSDNGAMRVTVPGSAGACLFELTGVRGNTVMRRHVRAGGTRVYNVNNRPSAGVYIARMVRNGGAASRTVFIGR